MDPDHGVAKGARWKDDEFTDPTVELKGNHPSLRLTSRHFSSPPSPLTLPNGGRQGSMAGESIADFDSWIAGLGRRISRLPAFPLAYLRRPGSPLVKSRFRSRIRHNINKHNVFCLDQMFTKNGFVCIISVFFTLPARPIYRSGGTMKQPLAQRLRVPTTTAQTS